MRFQSDTSYAPLAGMNLHRFREWLTPPAQVTIRVLGDQRAYVSGTGRNIYDGIFPWYVQSADVASTIERVRQRADELRAQSAWEAHLNDVDPGDLDRRLRAWRPTDWSPLPDDADEAHRTSWATLARSAQLRRLASEGSALCNKFFPRDSELRHIIDAAAPGTQLSIVCTRESGSSYIPNVPWGLMYLLDLPKSGEAIDPTGFLALRFRLEYVAYPVNGPSPALGSVEDAHKAHLLYWGRGDATATEADRQRMELAEFPNVTLLKTGVKNELVELLAKPQPTPTPVLYMFCQAKTDAVGDPRLRFANTSSESAELCTDDLRSAPFDDRPVVFANACATATGEPYMASELEAIFFERNARAYLGVETKVPIAFASRFAVVFFRFFYRTMNPDPLREPPPISAGEAVSQTRLFFWTQYRNIGGILYAYINKHAFTMAKIDELTRS